MEYKPYSPEWHRKRYLSEAISKYFEDDAPTEVVVEDIVDLLETWAESYQKRSDDIQKIIKGLNRR